MNTPGTPGHHDPLGLFWYASWMGGHGFFVSLLLCLFLAPLAMMLIAPIFETRLLPLGKAQFDGFFPGTLFLAIGTAILLKLANGLPSEAHWYNSFWWHFAVQAATIVGAVIMTLGDRKIYPKRALWSPTKIWNNLMYAFYGYVLITVIVAQIFGAEWGFWMGVWEAVAALFIAMWVVRLRRDARLPKDDPDLFNYKVASAHREDWKPIWSTVREILAARR